MTSVADALREAAKRLSATSDTGRLDAELLMAHALRCSRSHMLLRHGRDETPGTFGALVARRERHEPIAYILGYQEFYGREFTVTPAVLIPRPDSETTVAAALEACPAPRRVLDCGVGSGALLLTVLAERPGAHGVGVDRTPEAVEVATKNALGLGLDAHCAIRLGDWNRPGWSAGLGRFDLILANPPYVEVDAVLDPDVREWEPPGALFAGSDGLDDYRILVPQLPALLADGGVAVFEIGDTQAAAVDKITADAGFACELRHDLGGRPRALVLRLRLGK